MTGQHVVLLHGWGTDPDILNGAYEKLASTLSGVLIYELPGYGSRCDEEGDVEWDALVDDAVNFAPPNSIWVGWSLGAMIALAAATSNETAISGVIAVCGTASFCYDQNRRAALNELRTAVAEDPSQAMRRFQRSMPAPQNRRRVAKELRELKTGGHASPQTLLAGLDLLKQVDLSETVSKMRVPLLLVSGKDDTVIPHAASRMLNELVEGSRLVTLPCGHVPFLECPELFMEQLVEFAQSIAVPGSDSEAV